MLSRFVTERPMEDGESLWEYQIQTSVRPEMSKDDAKEFRRCAARLNYMAQDRPDLCVSANLVSRSMAVPRIGDEKSSEENCSLLGPASRLRARLPLARDAERDHHRHRQRLGRVQENPQKHKRVSAASGEACSKLQFPIPEVRGVVVGGGRALCAGCGNCRRSRPSWIMQGVRLDLVACK